MNRPPQTIDELLDRLSEDHRKNAKAWCVVTIDDELEQVVGAEGFWAEPVDALTHAAYLEAEDKRLNPGSVVLWSYKVVPFWERGTLL